VSESDLNLYSGEAVEPEGDSPEEKAQSIMRLTVNWGQHPLAVIKEGLFTNRNRPEGSRERPECAHLVISEELTKKGVFQLRYEDKTHVEMPIPTLSKFDILDPRMVTKKLVIVDYGEKDLTGEVVKRP